MYLLKLSRVIAALSLLTPLHPSAIAGPDEQNSRPLLLDFDSLAPLGNDLKQPVESGAIANLSYGVWQNGHLVRAGFYGPISETNSAAVSDDTIQRIYSMTKPITAVGLLILMERGAFELDDPITKFLPEFERTEVLADIGEDGTLYTYRPPRPPTMEQLLSHTAGIGYHALPISLVSKSQHGSNVQNAPNSDALVQSIASIPYELAPGAEWSYSFASDLQGAIIERISGEDLHSFLSRELFDPLDMIDTGFYVTSDKMHRVSGLTHRESTDWAHSEIEAADQITQSATYFEGGHGLFTTQRDYARFLAFLLNEGRSADSQLLKPETLSLLRTNAIKYRGDPSRMAMGGKRAGLGFGFGVAILEDPELAEMTAPPGTFYWYSAAGSWFWVDPLNKIFFIGMVQSESELDEDLIRLSMRRVYQSNDWVPGIEPIR